MTAFDLVVIAILALSTLLALWRGIIREVIGLVAWVAAFVLAFVYAGTVAAAFARPDWNPALLQVLAFGAIFVGVLVLGAVIASLLARAVQAVGLGVVDRGLGALFGLVRGLAIVLIGVLVAGLTSAPRAAWWQESLLAAPLVAVAMHFRDWLPDAWASRLDYSPGGRGRTLDVRLDQENEACAES